MSGERFPIASAGWGYLLLLAVVSLGFYLLYKPLSILTILLFLFVAYFFRNPNRITPEDKKHITSPADGLVMSVSNLENVEFIDGPAQKISIFLSLFDVHINRSPVAGEIKYTKYVPGKFLPAFKSHASEINERNYIGIEAEGYKYLVCQITGFIARRIVCYVKKGDQLNKGQIFGLIKFGSCTEIYMPVDIEVLVKPGERVKAGETTIGRFPDGHN